jgi:hypothetical protein
MDRNRIPKQAMQLNPKKVETYDARGKVEGRTSTETVNTCARSGANPVAIGQYLRALYMKSSVRFRLYLVHHRKYFSEISYAEQHTLALEAVQLRLL